MLGGRLACGIEFQPLLDANPGMPGAGELSGRAVLKMGPETAKCPVDKGKEKGRRRISFCIGSSTFLWG